jgi:oligopeptide/dipeptide ABC transporter ATP-binding protein
MSDAPAPILSARHLSKEYRPSRVFGGGGSAVRAVDDVSIDVRPGETFGLVGESGCGKSTLGRLLMRLLKPTSGQVLLGGVDIHTDDREGQRQFRRTMQIIFQDPYSSLNPAFRVRNILWEGLRQLPETAHESAAERRQRMIEILGLVDLGPEFLERYVHQLSGGQRQRIGIARALTMGPRIIVADEPVSALDVSVQAQVLDLFIDLQQRLGLTYVFISHDLSVIRYLCDRVAVMYLGRIVEQAPAEELFADPKHPYTKALLAAVPRIEAGAPLGRRLIAGELPSPSDIPTGCRYHPRCPFVMDRCRTEDAGLVVRDGKRLVACHLYEPMAPEATSPNSTEAA